MDSYNENLTIIPLVFYFGAIFWTLGYDTIYGYQDLKDDEIIGVKSTSIKFKKNPKLFLFVCYSIFFISLFYIGLKMNFSYIYFFGFILIFLHLFIFQILQLNINSERICLKIFKSNNFLGFLVFVNIINWKNNYMMTTKETLARLYNDYTKKYVNKIIASIFFQ